MKEELLSIIIPVYNSANYLEKCLDSVIEQSYKNLEIIIIENYSSDDSYSICKRYEAKDSRIKLFREKEKGAARARNTGLREAKGTYVTFVDSDDYLELNAYECAMDEVLRCQTDYVGFSYSIVDESGKTLPWYTPRLGRYIKRGKILNGMDIASIFLTSRDVEGFGWNKIFKMSIFRDNMLFFDETKRAFEDMPVIFEAILNCKSASLCDKKLYNYRQNSKSLTHETYRNKQLDYKNAIKLIIGLANSHHLEKEAECFWSTRFVLLLYMIVKNKSDMNNYMDMYKQIGIKSLTLNKSEPWKTIIKFMIIKCKIEKTV